MSSRTLQRKDKNQLSEWIGKRKSFDLLYKASRDGCSAEEFHARCDNKGPTVTVLYNTAGCTFGGYTAASWDSSGTYKADNKAFLFRMSYKSTWNPKKYGWNGNDNNCIHCDSSYGPTFGGGHDLYSFSGTVNINNGRFALNGYLSNFGNTFNNRGDNAESFAASSLQCYDLEVYKVSDYTGSTFEEPWRVVTQAKPKALKTGIEKYAPVDGLEVKFVNVLLIGAVGAGKSSYFNTINSIFRGHVTAQACSGDAEHSLTTQYRKYRVRCAETGGTLKFRLCDTRGLEDDQGIDAADVVAILDGHLRNKYTFNPAAGINSDSPGYKKSPTLQDKIHCIAFVVDGCSVGVFSKKILSNIKSIQLKANQRGIPHVILLTKVDKVCKDVAEDTELTFCSQTISDLVDKTSEMIGLPRGHVLPVKNYEQELELNDAVDIPALISLRQILRFCDDYLYNFLDEDQ